MSAANWLLWMALSAVATAAVVVHYSRRETPGRGRLLLAGLRSAAFALALLLLFSPELPGVGDGGRARGAQVLLDASLSMNVPGADGETAWERGVAAARARAGRQPVLLFGDGARPVAPDALPAQAPGDARSRLLPALQAAAEAGVRRVVVLTDGRLEDAEAVARWAARLGIEIVPELLGEAAPNRSLVEASAPTWAEPGRPVRVEFGIAGDAADSLRVVARLGGRVVGRTAVPPPAPGRLATGALDVQLEGPAAGGWVRLELELEGDDVVPDDDRRTVYIHVSAEPAGIALVSFRPDWEPRFLAPVLEQALGLPLRGWIRGATGQYIRLAGGLDAGVPTPEAQIIQTVGRAELLVLHGAGPDLPQWAVDALSSARRVLVFPAEATGGVPLPVSVGAPAAGDYYVASAIPSSPIAPLLAGIELTGATPLPSLRPAEATAGAWTPLHATRGRQGAPQPVLLAGETGGRRWAVALGSGYWQWAFRGGDERVLYARLWSAVAGWLARERAVAGLDAVRPGRLAATRGVPLPWIAAGVTADSVTIRLTTPEGTVALDTVVSVTAGDTAFTAAPAPGEYSYRARAFTDGTVAEATGPLTVERFSPEFARPRVDAAALEARATAVRGDAARRGGTPLHATAVPWVLIVLLLAAEWILRRRWGLR
jgi:hypothetical protein